MRILTGIKPTGLLHLGNYFGALKPALEIQDETFFCIANYHAFTVPSPSLKEDTRKLAAALIALGCSNQFQGKYLYLQSHIPEVQELAWILSCLIQRGVLDRGHAVKAATDKGLEISVGTYLYPALMAADILLFQTDAVPVGEDQHQHVQIAQDLGNKLNIFAGEEVVKIPQAIIQKSVGVIPGTDGQKMSKSYGNVIPLFDKTDKEIQKIISGIKTDSTPMETPMEYKDCNVYNLYKLLAPQKSEQMMESYHLPTYGYGHAKKDLYKAFLDLFGEQRKHYQKLMEDPDAFAIRQHLIVGHSAASQVAKETMKKIKEKVGFGII